VLKRCGKGAVDYDFGSCKCGPGYQTDKQGKCASTKDVKS
jgi:hypothetical protein